MNEVFIIGKIVSKINFKFIINSKNISIVIFYLYLNENNVLKVKGDDVIADYCYSKLKTNDYVFINGKLSENYIEINEIIKL